MAVPEFLSIARYKLTALQAAGWRVNGYSLIKEDRRGFIDHGGFVGWWLPEHYPQHTATPPTYADAEAKADELQVLFDRVKLWPENRMKPDAVLELGEGFTQLLDLRNAVPGVIAAIRSLASPAPKGEDQ